MPRKPIEGAPRYRIKDGAPAHYINGDIRKAGAIVSLPEGVEPGSWLEEVKDLQPVKSEQKPADKK